MKLYFTSMAVPKKAAKRICKHFSSSPIYEPMPLHQAQNIAAWMLGYDNWHELEQVTKSGKQPPSPLDEDAPADEQVRRIDFQAKVLGYITPLTEPLLRELALKFRVSAKNPISTRLAEDGYRTNTVFLWTPYGESPEWRFRPSGRSGDMRDYLDELLQSWDRQVLSLEEYRTKLLAVIEEQPENLVPHLSLLSACEETGSWEYLKEHLAKLETLIKKSLPANYPMRKKVPAFNWGTIDNRVFLRSLYYLGVGYYAIAEYEKAKFWFMFLTRCSPIELGTERYFLADLRRPVPDGDLHLLEGKEIWGVFEGMGIKVSRQGYTSNTTSG